MTIMVEAVSIDVRQRRGNSDDDLYADKYPFGFNLLLGGSDGFVSVLLHRPGAINCADRLTNLLRYLTLERTG